MNIKGELLMSGKIFALRDGEGLTELIQTPYENEDFFQTLIEKHPEILAGEQINPDNPRKWVLISREMGVSLDDGIGRLDHLYIDQDAIPTFLEVKRGTDTRIRREVVGQMLDYAANGTQFWPISDIRAAYERNAIDGKFTTLSEIGIEDEDTFWQNVDMNLRNGKVRLLFVADVIPTSLQAIIEFLNKQMRDTEVYGLEIKQYVGKDGLKTLVPNLIGRTASAVQAKRGETKQKYASRNEFFDSVESQHIKTLYTNLFAFADKNNCKIGLGTSGFSFNITNSTGTSSTLIYGYGSDAQWDNRKNCIETTFWLSKEMNGDVLESYKNMVSKLSFFEPTSGGKNFKWQLSDQSSDDEMQKLMAVIQEVANKING
jgi:hypothetical protein